MRAYIARSIGGAKPMPSSLLAISHAASDCPAASRISARTAAAAGSGSRRRACSKYGRADGCCPRLTSRLPVWAARAAASFIAAGGEAEVGAESEGEAEEEELPRSLDADKAPLLIGLSNKCGTRQMPTYCAGMAYRPLDTIA